jgi:pSer/pThr/pTyr-binding forkhead associated (FHA) protein
MDSTITLIVTRGPLVGREFAFGGSTTCLIGRSRDCTIALPMEAAHMDVSRHHCEVEIAPSALRVRDLGSLNGTYVNGKKIGQRGVCEADSTLADGQQPAVDLSDGDEIQLGQHTAFRVCLADVERRDSPRKQRRSSGELRFEEPVHS